MKWDTVIEQKAIELGRYLDGKSGRLDFTKPAPTLRSTEIVGFGRGFSVFPVRRRGTLALVRVRFITCGGMRRPRARSRSIAKCMSASPSMIAIRRTGKSLVNYAKTSANYAETHVLWKSTFKLYVQTSSDSTSNKLPFPRI